MDVSSVKSSPVAQPQPSPRAQQAKPAPSEPKPAEAKPAAEPKPVVNTQGHSTGRLLNVTA